MIAKTADKINTIGGFIPIITPDGEIILKFRTHGTCFPARADGYTTRPSYFQVLSYPTVDNKVYIDYSDGTGEHEYTFKPNNDFRGISFRCNSTSDPTQVAVNTGVYGVKPNDGFGGGEFGLHFYQDLANAEKINTVDHAYTQERDVYIRFENTAQIQSVIFYNIVLLGTFPSLAKLRNLTEQMLILMPGITAFENQALSTLLQRISLADLGISSNTLPLWIKNSPVKDLNIDSYLVTNTAQEFETEVIEPLKDTLEILSMDGVPMNYALPESFSEMTKLKSFSLERDYAAENFAFPADLSTLTEFKILSLSERIKLPLAQVKRFIHEVPTTGKNINIRTFGATPTSKDFVLDADDYSVEELNASYGRWNNGIPPTCVGQMKALKRVTIYGSYNYTVATSYNLTGWGDFSGATALESIYFDWQQKMNLNFPAWLTNLPNFKTFSCTASFETQQAFDDFVDSVYSFVTANASLAAGNTPFRYMNIIAYDSSRAVNSWTPSGVYQEPAGYAQNSSNGTPTTPMEKMYCLINNYNHSWNVKPT
ncbi:hypothetical protein GCM10007424_23920 [Flavobacterium suaedae]|uniref:Leucine-rich repeat domain-containing protein n=1 Tax=Flavobacterium suaedae TaxID=1767027 RepID=A0ABQ1JZA8_9FLAO|nr:hypothetical protein [Flavobacterium suaedae]GGB83116.1 hypothetical protein GCM10007424_23920 [Flavobacterium suaedae]